MRTLETQSRQFAQAEAAVGWCVKLSEGEMTSRTRAEFTRWLEADPLHRKAFEEVVATWEHVRSAESDTEVLTMRVSALEGFRRAQHSQRRAASRVSIKYSALGASIAAALLVALAWWTLSPQRIASGVGERRNVTLADGSKISLDASSSVLVRYSGSQRSLQLKQGRAKFDVAKDARRPFIVHVPGRQVVATGTQFSVELVQNEVSVILYEGHVSVIDAVRSTALSAGQQLIAPLAGGQVIVRGADVARSLSWESGQLEFVDEPLAAAIERVNRYSHIVVSVADESAATLRISGAFAAGDSRAFVEGVTAIAPLRVEEHDGRVILSSGAQAAP